MCVSIDGALVGRQVIACIDFCQFANCTDRVSLVRADLGSGDGASPAKLGWSDMCVKVRPTESRPCAHTSTKSFSSNTKCYMVFATVKAQSTYVVHGMSFACPTCVRSCPKYVFKAPNTVTCACNQIWSRVCAIKYSHVCVCSSAMTIRCPFATTVG